MAHEGRVNTSETWVLSVRERRKYEALCDDVTTRKGQHEKVSTGNVSTINHEKVSTGEVSTTIDHGKVSPRKMQHKYCTSQQLTHP